MRSQRTDLIERLLPLLLVLLLGLALLALFIWYGRPSGAAATPLPTPTQIATNPTPELVSALLPEAGATTDAAAQQFDLSGVAPASDGSLSPVFNPRTFVGKRPEHGEFQTYVVERGDTPIRIAEQFGIKPETLLGGNPFLNENAGMLQVGDQLIILPVDGVLHDVQPGESLESIAALYSVAQDEIIAYAPNNLEFPFRLYPETQILVPGAVREVFKWDPPRITAVSGRYWGSQSQPLIVGTGVFIRPNNGGRITQTYWYGHQALDIGLTEGTPIYAADTGTVTYATWSPYCYGNLIVIDHGNGFETFYAHLSGFNVVAGQIVYKGNLIGYSGNTGCSSGPHLHVEVRVNGRRDDPTWWLPGY